MQVDAGLELYGYGRAPFADKVAARIHQALGAIEKPQDRIAAAFKIDATNNTKLIEDAKPYDVIFASTPLLEDPAERVKILGQVIDRATRESTAYQRAFDMAFENIPFLTDAEQRIYAARNVLDKYMIGADNQARACDIIVQNLDDLDVGQRFDALKFLQRKAPEKAMAYLPKLPLQERFNVLMLFAEDQMDLLRAKWGSREALEVARAMPLAKDRLAAARRIASGTLHIYRQQIDEAKLLILDNLIALPNPNDRLKEAFSFAQGFGTGVVVNERAFATALHFAHQFKTPEERVQAFLHIGNAAYRYPDIREDICSAVFDDLRKLKDPEERVKAAREIVHWTNSDTMRNNIRAIAFDNIFRISSLEARSRESRAFRHYIHEIRPANADRLSRLVLRDAKRLSSAAERLEASQAAAGLADNRYQKWRAQNFVVRNLEAMSAEECLDKVKDFSWHEPPSGKFRQRVLRVVLNGIPHLKTLEERRSAAWFVSSYAGSYTPVGKEATLLEQQYQAQKETVTQPHARLALPAEASPTPRDVTQSLVYMGSSSLSLAR